MIVGWFFPDALYLKKCIRQYNIFTELELTPKV